MRSEIREWEMRSDAAFAVESRAFGRTARVEIAIPCRVRMVGGSKSGSNEARFYRNLVRMADGRFAAPPENTVPKKSETIDEHHP
jgi:hypothetical protein